MSRKKSIIYLFEMPLTNGVIQSQLVPVIRKSAQTGFANFLVETRGRFDNQENFRPQAEAEIKPFLKGWETVFVKQRTYLPSIFHFTLKTLPKLRSIVKSNPANEFIIYARNYKFAPALILFSLFSKIRLIYSPRGAYVSERVYYRTFRDTLFKNLIGFFEKRLIKKSFKTIVETEYFRDYLIKNYQLKKQEDKFVTIPNYFDASKLPKEDWDRKKERERLGFRGKKVIVYAGTAEVWYDFRKMFDLVAKLKERDSRVFFQLFLKKDYARQESKETLAKIKSSAEANSFKEGKDFSLDSFSPLKRYRCLCACDAGICLTTRAEFKVIMLYLKILDYLGAGLPLIVNNDILKVRDIINSFHVGVLVDYKNWEKSLMDINLNKLWNKNEEEFNSVKSYYSSTTVVPQYIQLFNKCFHGLP